MAPDGEMAAAIMRPGLRLVSFDVFDTVLTRSVGEPDALFLLLGRDLHARGLLACTPETFARQRVLCEHRARFNNGFREVSLRQIYAEVGAALDIHGDIAQWIEAEMAAEAEHMRPIPHMRSIVEAARRRFGQVVFISDMYLPAAFLESRLRAMELLAQGDRLYVSSAFGVQKRKGELFRIVLEHERLQARELLHFGDNLATDVLPARAMGIHIHHVKAALPKVPEQVLNAHATSTEGFTAYAAGAGRLARLRGMHLHGDERVAWEMGASVTGPLVHLFAQWIIGRAKQKGVTRLRFLARDGYLPFLAVRGMIARDPEIGLDARYVHGSRQTYNLLGVSRFGAEEWSLLATGGEDPYTIEELQELLPADPAVFAHHLAGLGFTDQDWRRPLDPAELERIRIHAIENPELNCAILDGIRRFQECAADYLRREGVAGEDNIALVDAGWTTRSHAPLFRFLEQRGARNLHVFYMGLVVVERIEIPPECVDAFVFDRERRQGIYHPQVSYPRAVESLLLANHGRARSFRRTEDGVVPVLDASENAEFLKRFYSAYEGGVLAYLDEIAAAVPGRRRIAGGPAAAEAIIARFWLNPTAEEARVWSRLEWGLDRLGRANYLLARPYRLKHALRAFTKRKFPECGPQFWVGGAVLLSPPATRRFLAAAIFAGRVGARLLRAMPPGIRQSVRSAEARFRQSRLCGALRARLSMNSFSRSTSPT